MLVGDWMHARQDTSHYGYVSSLHNPIAVCQNWFVTQTFHAFTNEESSQEILRTWANNEERPCTRIDYKFWRQHACRHVLWKWSKFSSVVAVEVWRSVLCRVHHVQPWNVVFGWDWEMWEIKSISVQWWTSLKWFISTLFVLSRKQNHSWLFVEGRNQK